MRRILHGGTQSSSMNLERKDYWKSLINMSLTRSLILEALNKQPAHGYAILEKVALSTQGCCTPTYGGIYPVLKQLVEGDYATVRSETVGGRERKVYELTGKGRHAYDAATAAWAEVLPFISRIVQDHSESQEDKVLPS